VSAAGRTAVARALAGILAERHPGTTWLPVQAAQLDADTRTGQITRRLAPPENLDSRPVEGGVAPDDLRAA
jgi:hypothetical protein